MEGKARPSEHEQSKVRKYRGEKGRWGSAKKRHMTRCCWFLVDQLKAPSPHCAGHCTDSEHWAGSLRTYELSKRCMCDGEEQPCASEAG